MSLANMSQAFSSMKMRARMAEDQQRDFEELIAQWFLDSNPGAREFLREIAKDHRERHPMKPTLYNTRQEECSPLKSSRPSSDATISTIVTSNS